MKTPKTDPHEDYWPDTGEQLRHAMAKEDGAEFPWHYTELTLEGVRRKIVLYNVTTESAVKRGDEKNIANDKRVLKWLKKKEKYLQASALLRGEPI